MLNCLLIERQPFIYKMVLSRIQRKWSTIDTGDGWSMDQAFNRYNKMLKYEGIRDGPWSYPTRAYFWPTVNKRPTCLWLRYFLTQPKEIFFIWREKIEKFDIFRGNFPNPNPNYKWLTRPDPVRATKNCTGPKYQKYTRPGSKIFDPDPPLEGMRRVKCQLALNMALTEM